MQITKQIAGILYGNGYLLQHVESGKAFRIEGINTDFLGYPFFIAYDESESEHEIFFEAIGTEYKILARPNDLTKAIVVEGKEINLYKKMWLTESDLSLVNMKSKTADFLRNYNYAMDINPEWLIYNETIYNS